MALRFGWDPEKERKNRQKHGVSFDEAATALSDPLSATRHDAGHSTKEDRFVTIGSSRRGKLLVVVHTDRGDLIRIISARAATRPERSQYEEEG